MMLDAAITILNFDLAKVVGFEREFKAKNSAPSQLPCKLLPTVSRDALIRELHKAASCFGSLCPATMASRMFNPVSPTNTLMTLLNCTFISKSAFCMWMNGLSTGNYQVVGSA